MKVSVLEFNLTHVWHHKNPKFYQLYLCNLCSALYSHLFDTQGDEINYDYLLVCLFAVLEYPQPAANLFVIVFS